MGKKTRKTRWRTLPIADESDSEESNALSGSHQPTSKSYHHRPFYSKLSYSSQSTPTRRFQYEPKSTRSSSTASENKITFNEDEYTKITTPRQDVLFKKGYLSKPKNYQTQTSTGNSTASTGNSTGNGTPDHQSADGTEGTDLEYESQFVFPNAFVDQNGIYYINSYEHYPLVVYNPPICYPEYPLSRTKRHSTGSLTESTSPHTEEASQDLSQSGGENTGNGPEFNHVYNVIYPGYYYNGVCSSNVTTNGQAATEPRKIKKKRRRKISKTVNQDETTSSEDCYSSDEAITQVENRVQAKIPLPCNGVDQPIADSTTDAGSNKSNNMTSNAQNIEVETANVQLENDVVDLQKRLEENKEVVPEESLNTTEGSPSKEEATIDRISQEEPQSSLPEDETPTTDQTRSIVQNKEDKNLELEQNQEASDNNQTPTQETIDANQKEVPIQAQINPTHVNHPDNLAKSSRFNLNAEEFIPRAFRPMEHIPVDPNLQFINIHPNFVPLPLINHPLNELNPPPSFNPPFLPPGIPLNFMPADPKMIPNFINFVPNHFAQHPKNFEENRTAQNKVEESKNKNEAVEKPKEDVDNVEMKEDVKKVEEKQENEVKEVEKVENLEKAKNLAYKTEVDIAKIVSKLEEAAKEQTLCENRRQNYRSPSKFNKTPRQRFNSPYQNDYKQENYRQSYEKRRPRRFETKTNEHPEIIEPTPTNRNETTENQPTIAVNTAQNDLQTKTEPKDTRPAIAKSQEEDRRYSPRHQNYKNINSPRKYINNYNNRIAKNTRMTQEIHQQLSHSIPNTENYSDTLKKPSNYSKSCPRFQKYASNRSTITTLQNKVPSTIKLNQTEKEVFTNKSPILNRTSQWIPVSSKKKRKSRSTNEDETETANEESDLPQKPEENVPKIQELEKMETNEELTTIPQIESKVEDLESSTKIENIIEMITKSEATSQIKTTSTNDIPMIEQIQLKDVKDIEKELLRNSIEETTTEQKDTAKEDPPTKPNESPPIQTHLKPLNVNEMQKKKTKKSGSKNNTKRIIILDPDVSKEEIQKVNKRKEIPKAKITKVPQESEIEAPKISEDVPKIEETENKPLEKEKSPESVVLTPLEEPGEILTTPDKKKLKKKKKQNKSNLSSSIPSISSSSTTLNNMDDSYDFLLDTTALVNDKTNVEVSEEFDKMIQKGLYGNLEEKIRSLNVSVDDDFFKSLSLKPRNQSTPEKGFIKATNFTTILNNTNSLSKKNLLDTGDKINVDFSKIKLPDYEPQPSTSKSGNFLGSVIESETGPPIKETSVEQVSNSKSNGKLKNKSKKNSLVGENETVCKDVLKNDENILQNEENVEVLSEKDEGSLTENFNHEKKEEGLNQENELSTLDSLQNDIQEDDFFRKGTDTIEENLSQKNEGEIQKKIDNIDNKSDQNESKYVTIQNIEKSSKNDPPKPINGYIFHSGNAKFEISLETSNIDNNFFKNDQDLSKKPIEDDQIIIEIQENIIQNNQWKKLKQEAEVVVETNNGLSDPESLENSYEMKPLYPITNAVKEWMSKTRETTPEIEILKSPETIYKELIEDNSDDDSDTETNQKNAIGNPSPVDYLDDQEICHYSTGERVANVKIPNSEDDITICETWSMSQDTSLHDEDLLDCWEPDIVETSKKEMPIEQAEDVLELIGKNFEKDDKNEFLRLKAEIEEQKRNGAFPRHADLPYRAICCSLM